MTAKNGFFASFTISDDSHAFNILRTHLLSSQIFVVLLVFARSTHIHQKFLLLVLVLALWLLCSWIAAAIAFSFIVMIISVFVFLQRRPLRIAFFLALVCVYAFSNIRSVLIYISQRINTLYFPVHHPLCMLGVSVQKCLFSSIFFCFSQRNAKRKREEQNGYDTVTMSKDASPMDF